MSFKNYKIALAKCHSSKVTHKISKAFIQTGMIFHVEFSKVLKMRNGRPFIINQIKTNQPLYSVCTVPL